MKFNNYNLNRRIALIISLFSIFVVLGIVFVLRHVSDGLTYRQVNVLVIFSAIYLLAAYIIVRYFHIFISNPLKKIAKVSKLASVGDLSEEIESNSDDEIGEIASSINAIIRNQLNLAEFAEKIGDGNFDVDYQVLSAKDKLGSSITGMRDKLQKLSVEDEARNWVSAGLTNFSEILRNEDENLSELCDKFLSSLIKYLEANQGMIYLNQEREEMKNKPLLELVSAYAWNRKKHLSNTIEPGEGLIGQVAIEKEKIYIVDVPDDFIRITSGLGDSNPRSILIVPLISNDELFGVIEIASFRPLAVHEIDFVEKLAEILASTISRVKTNEQTQKLLRDSQQLTEELRAQEEEMRQNLEEMNATQEEMQQRELERIGIFTAINNTLATAEFNMEGKIIHANEYFLQLMNYTLEDIENKTDRMFADTANEPIDVYNKFWAELRQGKSHSSDYKRIAKNGREIWINASYTPALNKDGVPYKVIHLATDITEKKNAELETKRQAEELRLQGEKLKTYTNELEDIKQNLSEKLNEASLGLKKKIEDIEAEKAKNIAVLEGCVDGVISFDHTGNIEYFNQAAEEIWGVQREKILGNNISTVIPLTLEQNGEGIKAYHTNNSEKKEISVRTEISWETETGKEFDLLVTLTNAKVNGNLAFTIFAQKISIDLF
jgi:PAS domain S-box-containing protein